MRRGRVYSGARWLLLRGVAIAPSFGGTQPFPPVAQGAFRVYSKRHLVRIVRTDAHGRFATRLPAGWYVIRHPATASDRIYASPAGFLITPRATTRLTVAVTWNAARGHPARRPSPVTVI
jgi:hypothetical protein